MYLKLLTTIILFFLSFQSAFSNETILPIKKPELNEQNATKKIAEIIPQPKPCLLYTSPSPRDLSTSRMPSSA